MDLGEFRQLRAGLIMNLPAAQGDALASAADKLRRRLESSSMFADVEVETTDDEDRLIIAMLRYRPGTAPRRVASFLEAIWVTEVRLPGLDAFHFVVEDGHVELESATGGRESQCFLTLHLVALEGTEEEFAAAVADAEERRARAGRVGSGRRRWFGRRPAAVGAGATS